MMSKMIATAPVAVTPVFVPKQEGTVEISLDDALAKIDELRTIMEPIKSQIDNLIEVAKAIMNAKGLTSHTTLAGVSARFATSQRSDINKELARLLLGPEWARVESFKTVKSFTVK